MEEEWKSLNGCNACINSNICSKMGNCIVLSIDVRYPVYSKAKRRLIQRLRTMPERNQQQFINEISASVKWLTEPQKEQSWKERAAKVKAIEPEYRTWGNRRVKLTRIEELFIEELNKPR